MVNKKIVVAVAKEENERKDVIDVLRCRDSVVDALVSFGHIVYCVEIEKKLFSDPQEIVSLITERGVDCVFNLFEGYSDDASKEAEFVSIMEKVGITYTGNSSSVLSLCLDKAALKEKMKSCGIFVPGGIVVSPGMVVDVDKLTFPVFVKPRSQDASVGIDESSFILAPNLIDEIVQRKITECGGDMLVETFIPGNEYAVALSGSWPYEVIGVTMIDYKKYNESSFLTYQSKWDKESPEYRIVADQIAWADDHVASFAVDVAFHAARFTGCTGYCRVDLRENNGKMYVLDINPNPDINIDSGFTKQALLKGYAYRELINNIVKLSLKEQEYAL